jgi:hypothetical protein
MSVAELQTWVDRRQLIHDATSGWTGRVIGYCSSPPDVRVQVTATTGETVWLPAYRVRELGLRAVPQ